MWKNTKIKDNDQKIGKNCTFQRKFCKKLYNFSENMAKIDGLFTKSLNFLIRILNSPHSGSLTFHSPPLIGLSEEYAPMAGSKLKPRLMSASKLTSKLSCWKIFDIFTFSSLAGLVFIWQQNTHKLTVNLYFHFWDLEKRESRFLTAKNTIENIKQ